MGDIKNIRSNMVWNAILREVCKKAKGADAKKAASKILKRFERIWRKTVGLKSMGSRRPSNKAKKAKSPKTSNPVKPVQITETVHNSAQKPEIVQSPHSGLQQSVEIMNEVDRMKKALQELQDSNLTQSQSQTPITLSQ